MKKISFFLWGLSLLSLPLNAKEISFYPIYYETTRGDDGGQSVSSLGVLDQQGSSDDWNRYIEFYTPGVRYQGTQTFMLPSSIHPETIFKMALAIHYKGPQKSFQTWAWKIYDWTHRRWVSVGDNRGAPSWIWKNFRYDITGSFHDYINASRNVRIQLTSNNAADDADVDFESIVLDVPDDSTPNDPTSNATEWWRPGTHDTLQIQFYGAIDTSVAATVYDLDLFDTDPGLIQRLHDQGKKVLCYINMGSWEEWRPDSANFPDEVKGLGNGWPGEKWLDIRRLDLLGPLMEARVNLCQAKGFDGVEPDNINGYTNLTGFPLTYQDQLAYNLYLAQMAHARGLGIGLKNDLDQIPDLVDHYDWAINESCFVYDECQRLSPFIQAGKSVFNIEYQPTTAEFCPTMNALGIQSMRKNINLDAYREPCP